MYIISCGDYGDDVRGSGSDGDSEDANGGTERTLAGVWQRTRSAAVASAWSFSSAELGRDFSSFYSASLACQFRYL